MAADPTSIPAVFEPRQLRSGTKFGDLSLHIFQQCEMVWLCEVMRGDGGHGGWCHHIRTHKALARRYRLPVGGLRYWSRLDEDEYAFQQPMRCEPPDESILDRYSMRAVGRWKEQEISESSGDGREWPGALVSAEQLLELEMERTRKRAEQKW
ncbi:hypothetical protein B484DRAFT_408028 [Ochromonadaceae sp. CCMP2298]|nr:hypothetical protein B484DRAFT_408028 [Ochromonadaceae sp. CCMP2298]